MITGMIVVAVPIVLLVALMLVTSGIIYLEERGQ